MGGEQPHSCLFSSFHLFCSFPSDHKLTIKRLCIFSTYLISDVHFVVCINAYAGI